MLLDTRKKTETGRDRVVVGENIGFERTRRITGYLVGTLDRFNNAKRAEERDRVKHGVRHTQCPADAPERIEADCR
jgi:hypothetical protein